MGTFIATLRLARQDFFKLRRRHAAPEWALWVMTGLVSLAWGCGLSLVALVASGRLPPLRQALELALSLMLTSCIIGTVFHLVYTAIERLASDRFLHWANGRPGLLVNLFYATCSLACVSLGLVLSYLLLGQLPGVGRVDWAPQRSWISVSIFSAVVSALWGLWAWRQWHEEQLRRQAQEAQLRLLQAQIEPHFLFNTLANVHSLMDHDLPLARQMLSSFTDYLRASLGSMRQEHSSVAQELELARHYLLLLQARMADRLHFEIDVDAAAGALPLPPLLLQPLVENAVVHGLEPSIDGGTVWVRARVLHAMLQLEVQDDGRGLGAPPRPGARRGHGLALDNIRQRLRARFGPAATLDMQPAPAGTGTLARISIPMTSFTP